MKKIMNEKIVLWAFLVGLGGIALLASSVAVEIVGRLLGLPNKEASIWSLATSLGLLILLASMLFLLISRHKEFRAYNDEWKAQKAARHGE